MFRAQEVLGPGGLGGHGAEQVEGDACQAGRVMFFVLGRVVRQVGEVVAEQCADA